MAQIYGPHIVTDGLILSVDAGDRNSYPGTGTTWYDTSGNGRNGTFNGSITYSTKAVGSLEFNGPSTFDYVTFSDTITHKTGVPFTYECWVWFNSLSGYDKTIVGKVGCNVGLLQAGSNMGMVVFGPGGACAGGNTQYVAFGTATTGVWEHWVGVYNLGSIITYKNGSQVATTSTPIAIGNYPDTLYVGGSINVDYTGDCYISVVRAYNTAISATQVLNNYLVQKGRFGL